MNAIAHARAWLREAPGWTEDQQEADVRAWCKDHGWRVAIYKASELDREKWVAALRDNEAAILPRLDIIVAPPKKRETRPTQDFTRWLDRIRAKSLVVVDVWHSARSDDAERWDAALMAALRRVGSGRRTLPKEEARRMQRGSVKSRAARSAATAASIKWRGMKERQSKEWKTACAIWRSRDFANADEALRALPEELHALKRNTLMRIFGGRIAAPDKKPREPANMVIYFVKPKGRNRVKIGTTRDIKSRLNGLHHPLVGKMRVLATQPGGRAVERELHAKFREYHIMPGREWFRLEGDLLAYINALKASKQ
jgi:hypothetical protein